MMLLKHLKICSPFSFAKVNAPRIRIDSVSSSCSIRRFRSTQAPSSLPPILEYSTEEVEIPINLIKRNIAGILWEGKGNSTNESKQFPIICLHGWADNALSFGSFVPEIVKGRNISVYAFDLTGHGKSYHTPGTFTDLHYETQLNILRIMSHFKWDKVSILGHSFGGLTGLSFIATFPELVHSFIGLDIFHPLHFEVNDKTKLLTTRTNLEGILEIESKLLSNKPAPSYKRQEMIDRMYNGRLPQGGMPRESCETLISRGSIPNPNDSNLLQFSHDPRTNQFFFTGRLSLGDMKPYVDYVKCPTLVASTIPKEGLDKFPAMKYVYETLEKKAELFESYDVQGPHHVHMSEPKKISPFVNQFLDKVNKKP